MGNIADALKKAGVDLPSQENDERIVDETEVSSETTKTEKPSDIEVSEESKANEEVDLSKREQKVLDFDSLDERISLVTSSSWGASEAFRVLRSEVLHPKDGEDRPKTIMVTSSAPSEGKSFVSVNLAVAIARGLDQYSLLVDCDLRKPSLARILGLSGESDKGLADYLQGKYELRELLLRTSFEKLSLLTSGTIPENPAELLTSTRMADLVDEIAERYYDRLVIFDTPPFQVASESIVLAKKVDGVVLVVGYGKSDRVLIKNMVDLIGEDKIIGVVFNGMKESYLKQKLFYRYGGYGKYYSSSQKDYGLTGR